MSYPAFAFEGGPRQRPGVVTAAGYLLYGTAAAAVGIALVFFTQINAFADAIGDVARAEGRLDVDTEMSAARVAFGAAGGLILLVAVFFVLCAVFVMRGRNGMRITTWVVGGLVALCMGCGAIGGTFSAFVSTSTDNTSVPGTDTNTIVSAALPGWYQGVSATLDGASMLMLVVAIILLALPDSNAYFRKPMLAMPYGQPPYPGYPPTGYPNQAYPAQGYPGPGYGAPGYPAPGDQMPPMPGLPPAATDVPPWAPPDSGPVDRR